MVVLGIETVTRAGSLALWIDGHVDGRDGDPSTTHGVRLPTEATDWLARAGLRLQDVDRFAIVAGPGSFTGLRVGIATVQGWAMALGKLIVPVGTLDALVESWLTTTSDPRGLVVACLDGQRGDVFAAAFDVDGARTIDAARPRLPATVGVPAELAGEVAATQGGASARWIGSGATRYRDAIAAASPGATFADVSMPLALAAAAIAARHPERAVGPHAIRPIYVRRPDAVIAREKAGL
ncbi:MAG TPA: tRNA (adenosine(37)-N6)-threonylcarbamoyltransferase complex dimerization subunit type 1 TsaB, partial [Vicinamibacterales bacterium]|nr:tRNA (adenosine(37)-N6)-threonylcarbamoyltransferase complex dimerization subunit type 1 TsaB [Vicinamibacterales bacterium]